MDSQDERQDELAQTARRLMERVAALEDRAETLDDGLDESMGRITRLAGSTIANPRYPYWHWLVARGVSDETKSTLEYVLVRLIARIEGAEPLPARKRKDIEGVAPSILWSSGPPSVDDVYTAIKAVTGLERDAQCVDLVRRIDDQGLYQPVCELVLDAVDAVDDA